ncbi:hypothetical protein [Paenibacillus pabuli]
MGIVTGRNKDTFAPEDTLSC